MSLMAANEESDPSAILNGFWVTLHTHPACTFPYAYRSSRRAASNLTLPEVRVFSMKKESPVFLLIYGEGVHGGRGPTAYACGQFAVAGQESVRD